MGYRSKRSYLWSPNIAYVVGLMTSDGCLQKDGRHIDLTSVDIEQLTNFMTALGRQLHIGKKKSGAGRIGYRVQFSDVALYDFLLAVGLTPRKSKTLGSLCIPDIYYADFLRGLFDGDGSTYAYFDPRWRSSYMYYVQYAPASVAFLQYLKEQNQRLLLTHKGSIQKAGGAHVLSYAKADAYTLYKAMYYSANRPCLARKYYKLQGFIAADKIVTMSRDARVVKLVNTHA